MLWIPILEWVKGKERKGKERPFIYFAITIEVKQSILVDTLSECGLGYQQM